MTERHSPLLRNKEQPVQDSKDQFLLASGPNAPGAGAEELQKQRLPI